MAVERFWKKSYDPGLTDIDPARWEKSYVDAVAPIFKKFPARPALAFMGVEATFAGLDRYANRFTHMLLAQGLKKGDVVGINLPNIPEYVIAWLGILRAGCVVSGVSPLLSAEDMKYQLKDSRAVGLVTLDAIFAARFTKIVADLPYLKVVATTSVGGFKVFSKKVEEVMAEHPAIDMIAIIGLPNPDRPGSELVKAFVTPKPDFASGDQETLKADIMKMAKERLSPYEVPKTIEIRKELPLTVIGKIDKKVLRKEAI